MSSFIDKLREEFEGQEFPTVELKKEVFKLLNLKEEELASRSLEDDPPRKKQGERPKPDGGPSEVEVLINSISTKIETVRGNLKSSIEELLKA